MRVEQASAEGIGQKLRLIGDDGNRLLMLDKELAARTLTPLGAEGEEGGE